MNIVKWAEPDRLPPPQREGKNPPDDLNLTLNQVSSHKSERAPHITRNLLPFHTIIQADLSAASPRGTQGQCDACNSHRNEGRRHAARRGEIHSRFFFHLSASQMSANSPRTAAFILITVSLISATLCWFVGYLLAAPPPLHLTGFCGAALIVAPAGTMKADWTPQPDTRVEDEDSFY